jgi:hypothetical protein
MTSIERKDNGYILNTELGGLHYKSLVCVDFCDLMSKLCHHIPSLTDEEKHVRTDISNAIDEITKGK